MSIELYPLGSGSKGNCVFVQGEKTGFLIDCGLTVDETRRRLSCIGRSLDDVRFVLLTHEHGDHIRSAESLAVVYNLTLVAHEKTARPFIRKASAAAKRMLSFSSFAGFNFEQLHIQPFYLSHDVYTVGYKVQDGENRFVYATDLGAPSPRLIEISAGADEVMLESNYDADMLKNGRYPAYLKRRIQSDLGHLSNTDCADTLVRMAQNGTKCFILGHLSEENNLPALALQASEERLKGGGCTVRVAPQHEPLSTAKQSWEENAADNPATLRREALF